MLRSPRRARRDESNHLFPSSTLFFLAVCVDRREHLSCNEIENIDWKNDETLFPLSSLFDVVAFSDANDTSHDGRETKAWWIRILFPLFFNVYRCTIINMNLLSRNQFRFFHHLTVCCCCSIRPIPIRGCVVYKNV